MSESPRRSPDAIGGLVPAALERASAGGDAGQRDAAVRDRRRDPHLRQSDGPVAGDARLPAGLGAREHPPTLTDSFDALYAPTHVLIAPTAFAVHFLELVRPLLFPDPSVHYAEYARTYPNGLTFRVELHGNGKLGLPTVFDYDVLFAIFHLAAERGVSERGEMVGVTFRDLARAVGWSDDVYGGSRHKALKTSLNRWAALSIATNIDLDASRTAAEAREGRSRGHAVDALPRRVLPKLRWYDVLKYGIDMGAGALVHDVDDAHVGSTVELLGAIRIEPVWLDLIASGYTAWIDREFHASLDERYAKRLYEVLLVRALRVPTWGAHEPWLVRVNELLEEMGAPATAANGGRMRRAVLGKLPDLQAAGVVGSWTEHPGRGDRHRIEITPGERLLAARSCAGLRMHERPEIARLVWALQHGPWGFSLAEARHAAEARPAAALRVLQHAAYLLERGWEPRKSWGGWLKDALRDEYRFESDTRFQAWLTVRHAGYRVPAWVDVRSLGARALAAAVASHEHGGADPLVVPAGASTDAGDPPAASAPGADAPAVVASPEEFEDSVWGRVRRTLRDEYAASGQYLSYLRPLVALELPDAEADRPRSTDAVQSIDGIGPATLVLRAPDEFAAEWVARKWSETITLLAERDLGRPVEVRVAAETRAAGDFGHGARIAG